MAREMFADPTPGNEEDPEFMNEMFETYKSMGWKPEDLKEEKAREAYAKWLKKH